MMRYNTRFIKFSLVLLGLVFGFYMISRFGNAQGIEAKHAFLGKAIDAVYATAVVEPENWSAIAPHRTGRIIEVFVTEGQNVKKGDLLARMDDADLHAQLQEIKAIETLNEAELERAQKLTDSGATAKEKLEVRVANLAQTKARIKMIEEQIRQLSLIAPIDGTVLWRDIEVGEVKDANKILFWIGNPKPLRLKAEVDEEDIPKIKVGQKTLITADAFPDQVFTGQVNRISPKGDPVNKSYRVYVSLPEDTKLMIGMTVETNSIIEEKDNALLIPSQGLTDDSYVWLVQGNSLKKASVKIGIRGNENTEILEGLKENDLIALPPFDGFENQKRVYVQPHEKKE